MSNVEEYYVTIHNILDQKCLDQQIVGQKLKKW